MLERSFIPRALNAAFQRLVLMIHISEGSGSILELETSYPLISFDALFEQGGAGKC
jgi:hypothetical protein